MQTKLYKVREGFSIRLPDKPELYLAGGVIELDPQIAVQYHQLEPLSDDDQAAFEAANATAAAEAVERDIAADELRKESALRDVNFAADQLKQAKAQVADVKADIASSKTA